jgi:hypothetical protein
MCGGPILSSSKGPDPWQAEDDHRTLTRAAEVQNDPARMKGVVKHHRKMKKALATVGRSIGAQGGRLSSGSR